MIIKPGKLANLDGSARLSLPIGLLRAVEWWGDQSVEVMAELVQIGLIRLYLAEEARPLVEEQLALLADLPPELRFEREAVLADRYRSLKLYADGRLRFTKEVAQVMEFSLGEKPTLFVQPFANGLEVMSLTFRAERLARTADVVSIALHYQEPTIPPRK